MRPKSRLINRAPNGLLRHSASSSSSARPRRPRRRSRAASSAASATAPRRRRPRSSRPSSRTALSHGDGRGVADGPDQLARSLAEPSIGLDPRPAAAARRCQPACSAAGDRRLTRHPPTGTSSRAAAEQGGPRSRRLEWVCGHPAHRALGARAASAAIVIVSIVILSIRNTHDSDCEGSG